MIILSSGISMERKRKSSSKKNPVGDRPPFYSAVAHISPTPKHTDVQPVKIPENTGSRKKFVRDKALRVFKPAGLCNSACYIDFPKHIPEGQSMSKRVLSRASSMSASNRAWIPPSKKVTEPNPSPSIFLNKRNLNWRH